MRRSLLLTACVLPLASTGLAGGDSISRTYFAQTDAFGARIVNADSLGDTQNFPARNAPEIRWSYDAGFSIPQTVSMSGGTASAWVAEDLNFEALQRFATSGGGVPANHFDMTGAEFTAVGASRTTDAAALLMRRDGVLQVHLYTSQSTDGPEWAYLFPVSHNSAAYDGVKISRDGSRVAVAAINPLQGAFETRLYVFNTATGELVSQWSTPEFGGAVDLTDDGSKCLVTVGQLARLVDVTTPTGTLLFTANTSGSGGSHKVSGNGNVIVCGGFNLNVWVFNGTTYLRRINFSAPNEWYGWGCAVSRDGSTAAALSHDYASGYLINHARIWDVPSRTLLGTTTTTATGPYQDSISGGVLSDNGAYFACSSWGAFDNSHPEVRVFNRSVQMIGSVDTAGSPFDIDMTGDGVYVLIGSKAVHANEFGNGGLVTLYQARCLTGDVNCDCAVELTDLATLLVSFGLCDTQAGYDARADFDGDHCITLTDLATLLVAFGTGCGA